MTAMLALCALTVVLAVVPRADGGGPFESLAEVPAPAAAGSAQPQLAASADGRLVLSWLEPAGPGRHRLAYAQWERGGWSRSKTVLEGDEFFANWADVPSVFPLRDGRLAAHWLFKTAADTYAYHVGVKFSNAARTGWSDTIVPHADRSPTEHGFASFVEWPDGSLGVVWLDGRDFANHAGGHDAPSPASMQVRAVTFGRDDAPGDEMLIDDRACECCPTTAVRTDRGVLVAYRDRSAGEVRDIAVARFESGRWLPPSIVHQDEWQISGCPVNGPMLSARGGTVAIAWFTAARNDARVNVALSHDGGATWGAPVRADDGLALGRVDVEALDEGGAVVTWIEHNDGKPEFRARRIGRDGARGASGRITGMGGDRASGYPRMARVGGTFVFAWTQAGESPAVKTAVAALAGR